MRLRAQQYLIWIGIALAVIYFLAFWLVMGLVPPMSPAQSPEAIAAIFAHDSMRLRVGGIIMMAAAGFWLPFGAVISMQMARHETGFPIWSVLQAMASTLGALFFAFPVLIWYVAAFTARRNPEITTTLNELAWLAFLTPIAAFTLQLLPMIVICLTSREDGRYTAFPRWLAYLTIWTLFVGELPVTTIVFKTGPLAWNGLVFWCALIGYSMWFVAVSFLLLRAVRHQSPIRSEELTIAESSTGVIGDIEMRTMR
jgi:hypothetical protein